MSGLLPNGRQTFLDQFGVPLAGGTVTNFIPNTNTLKNTYQDQDLSIPNTNPITLDAAGTAVIWGAGSYRQVVADSNGNTVWDQITAAYGTDSGSGSQTSITYIIPRAGDMAEIVTGGTAVVLASGPCSGGYITNPPTPDSQGLSFTENLYVDPVAEPGSTDTTGNGTTSILYAGQSFPIPALASGAAVYANAATSGHQITVVVYP